MSFSTLLRRVCKFVSATIAQLFCRPSDNWDMLQDHESEEIWKKLAPLLEYYGFFAREDSYRQNLPQPPFYLPINPFNPLPNEDFIGRIQPGCSRMRGFIAPRNSHKIGIDHLGRDIYMKSVRSDSRELAVLRHLRQSLLKSDPRNHTIPVLRIIKLWGWSIIVQPRWGTEWQMPLKPSIFRLLETARDLVEGLAFMHLHGVAHGDIHPLNILCAQENARPVDPERQKDSKLYQSFIDFESAVIFPPHALYRYVTVQDIDTKPPEEIRAPEQEDALKWDGFAADVYNLGRCFQTYLFAKVRIICHTKQTLSDNTLQFATIQDPPASQAVIDIFNAMTRYDPLERISAEDAFQGLNKLLEEEGKLGCDI